LATSLQPKGAGEKAIDREKQSFMHTLSRPLNSQSSLEIFAEEVKAAANKPRWSKRVAHKALATTARLKPDYWVSRNIDDIKLPKMSLY